MHVPEKLKWEKLLKIDLNRVSVATLDNNFSKFYFSNMFNHRNKKKETLVKFVHSKIGDHVTMLQCYRAFTFNLYGITTMVPLFLTLSVWYPLKGYTYLKKHAGLFKYA